MTNKGREGGKDVMKGGIGWTRKCSKNEEGGKEFDGRGWREEDVEADV